MALSRQTRKVAREPYVPVLGAAVPAVIGHRQKRLAAGGWAVHALLPHLALQANSLQAVPSHLEDQEKDQKEAEESRERAKHRGRAVVGRSEECRHRSRREEEAAGLLLLLVVVQSLL